MVCIGCGSTYLWILGLDGRTEMLSDLRYMAQQPNYLTPYYLGGYAIRTVIPAKNACTE